MRARCSAYRPRRRAVVALGERRDSLQQVVVRGRHRRRCRAPRACGDRRTRAQPPALAASMTRSAVGVGEMPDAGDAVAAHGDVAAHPGIPGAVDEPAATDEEIERRRRPALPWEAPAGTAGPARPMPSVPHAARNRIGDERRRNRIGAERRGNRRLQSRRPSLSVPWMALPSRGAARCARCERCDSTGTTVASSAPASSPTRSTFDGLPGVAESDLGRVWNPPWSPARGDRNTRSRRPPAVG